LCHQGEKKEKKVRANWRGALGKGELEFLLVSADPNRGEDRSTEPVSLPSFLKMTRKGEGGKTRAVTLKHEGKEKTLGMGYIIPCPL